MSSTDLMALSFLFGSGIGFAAGYLLKGALVSMPKHKREEIESMELSKRAFDGPTSPRHQYSHLSDRSAAEAVKHDTGTR